MHKGRLSWWRETTTRTNGCWEYKKQHFVEWRTGKRSLQINSFTWFDDCSISSASLFSRPSTFSSSLSLSLSLSRLFNRFVDEGIFMNGERRDSLTIVLPCWSVVGFNNLYHDKSSQRLSEAAERVCCSTKTSYFDHWHARWSFDRLLRRCHCHWSHL